jgi:hypothetical protein
MGSEQLRQPAAVRFQVDTALAEEDSRPRLSAPPVSCFVFTLNGQLNLPYCLRSPAWCDDVVAVDSFSDDATENVASQFGARFVQT